MVEEEDTENVQMEGNDNSLGGGSGTNESEESNGEEEEVVKSDVRRKLEKMHMNLQYSIWKREKFAGVNGKEDKRIFNSQVSLVSPLM